MFMKGKHCAGLVPRGLELVPAPSGRAGMALDQDAEDKTKEVVCNVMRRQER